MLEHVRVVADLLQLHDRVHQGLRSPFALNTKRAAMNATSSQRGTEASAVRWQGVPRSRYLLVFLRAVGEEDSLLHVPVQDLLYGGHVAFDNILHLCEKEK